MVWQMTEVVVCQIRTADAILQRHCVDRSYTRGGGAVMIRQTMITVLFVCFAPTSVGIFSDFIVTTANCGDFSVTDDDTVALDFSVLPKCKIATVWGGIKHSN